MTKLKLESKEIKKKKELLKNAETVLKKEFIGIDKIIENTISNIRPWYLYPELQDKPLVITLVGLTGTGKTSFVKRLVQLLHVENLMSYFNFAEIGDLKPREVQEELDYTLSSCGITNRIFVYDEFQYASTLNENGMEKDNVTGLKPFWELMDSGCIHMNFNYGDMDGLTRAISYLDSMRNKMRNGECKNREEFLSETIEKGLKYTYCDYLNYNTENDTLLSEYCISRLENMCRKLDRDTSIFNFMNNFNTVNLDEQISFLKNIHKRALYGYDMNFENSLIFVMMNLDEAYTMSFDMDPDMSPDQFNKMTEKITIVDIKEALKRRFRNEQIARLGNLFMIYPSFTSDSYKKIIELYLDNYANKIKSKFEIEIKYSDSIKEILYKDTVFPTQGVRPILSGIHEIVKSKIPIIIDAASNNGIREIDSICIEYKKGNIIANAIADDKIVANYKIPQELRVESKRDTDDSEQQVRVAVHESGHFAVYAALMGKVPEKLCSKTLSNNTNGFMLFDMNDNRMWTREEILTNIKIALGGYIAEEIVFGKDKRGSGASNDLLKATSYASKMIRDYGMGSNPCVTTYLIDSLPTYNGSIINFDNQDEINKEIVTIINDCINDVKLILGNKHWRSLMKITAIYLSNHASISKEQMMEIYNAVPQNEKRIIDNNYYLRSLENFHA